MKPSLARSALALALGGLSLGLHAQTSSAGPDATQVVTLSASASQQAPHDWLRVVVRTRQEGAEPMTVQKQLKKTVDEALTRLRAQTKSKQVEVHSGAFGIHPRHNDKGRLVGWQGQAELVIEGRDFAKIGQLAGDVKDMAVESAQFSLSREARQQLEAEVQSQAVQRFRERAQQLAKDFGFKDYTLRQVAVGSVDQPVSPMPVAMMARAVMADAAPSPVPLEGGQDEVQITVSGSIQLR